MPDRKEVSVTLLERIRNGDYAPKSTYPTRGSEDWVERRAAYSKEQGLLEARFKEDLLKEHGVVGHPKVEKVWALAWDYGHSHGFHSVAGFFAELADLIKD